MTYLKGKEQSDLFKTHTIWVARLLAQDGTTVCVSEVTRSKEMERKGEKECVSNVSVSVHTCISQLAGFCQPPSGIPLTITQ